MLDQADGAGEPGPRRDLVAQQLANTSPSGRTSWRRAHVAGGGQLADRGRQVRDGASTSPAAIASSASRSEVRPSSCMASQRRCHACDAKLVGSLLPWRRARDARRLDVEAEPAPGLADVVDRYVSYELAGFEPGVHFGVPSPRHMTFIVSIGPAIDVVAQTYLGASRPSATGPSSAACRTTAWLIAHDGNQEGVEIELTPLGSRGPPRRANARPGDDQSFEWSDFLAGRWGREIWERLQVPAYTWSEPVRGVGRRSSSPGRRRGPSGARRAWRHGRPGWRQVGGRASPTRGGLEPAAPDPALRDRVRPRAAAPPSRVTRFERAQRMLRRCLVPPHRPGGRACGYSDQAHLDRDFAELAGCTPYRSCWPRTFHPFQDTEAERWPTTERLMSNPPPPTSVWPVLTFRDARSRHRRPHSTPSGSSRGAVLRARGRPVVTEHARAALAPRRRDHVRQRRQG